jgi:hypothetical protein
LALAMLLGTGLSTVALNVLSATPAQACWTCVGGDFSGGYPGYRDVNGYRSNSVVGHGYGANGGVSWTAGGAPTWGGGGVPWYRVYTRPLMGK